MPEQRQFSSETNERLHRIETLLIEIRDMMRADRNAKTAEFQAIMEDAGMTLPFEPDPEPKKRGKRA